MIESKAIFLARTSGKKTQKGPCRITTGDSDQSGLSDTFPVKLRQATHRPCKEVGHRMDRPIPPFVDRRVPETKVGAQIDHAAPGLEESGGWRSRGGMRQGQKDDLRDRGEPRRIQGVEGEVHESREAGQGRPHRFARVSLRRRRHHLHRRMLNQEPEEFRTGVTAGPGDGHLSLHPDNPFPCRHRDIKKGRSPG